MKITDFMRIYTVENVKKDVDDKSGKARKKSGISQVILSLKFERHPVPPQGSSNLQTLFPSPPPPSGRFPKITNPAAARGGRNYDLGHLQINSVIFDASFEKVKRKSISLSDRDWIYIERPFMIFLYKPGPLLTFELVFKCLPCLWDMIEVFLE